MSSGFPGGRPEYFNINNTNVAGRPMSFINGNNAQSSFRSPLAGILADSSSHIGLRRPEKRSLAEFQHHQQLQQAAFFFRNVKHRPYNHHLAEFPTSPEVSSVSNTSSVPRYGVPVMQQMRPNLQSFNLGVMGSYQNHSNHHIHNNNNNNNNRGGFSSVGLSNSPAKQSPAIQETEGKMMKRLQELEKELLLDDDNGENDVSGVTNSEWSETIQNILSSTPVGKPENTIVSPSPTSSSSSSCASSSASPATQISPNQLFSDAAAAISDRIGIGIGVATMKWKTLGGNRVEKLKVDARSYKMKIWIIRGTTMVLLWTCLIQLTALGDTWGPRVLKGFSDDSHSLDVKFLPAVPARVFPPKRVYRNNGYLMVSCNGGLNQMRSAICDMVAIARFLNVTLIVPELDKTSFWADPIEFEDIFDVDHFITSLRDEVQILKQLPPRLKKRVLLGFVHTMPPVSWSDISYYHNQGLSNVLRLIQSVAEIRLLEAEFLKLYVFNHNQHFDMEFLKPTFARRILQFKIFLAYTAWN